MGTTGPEGDPGLLITISTAGKQILAGPRVWKEDRGEGREEVEGGREVLTVYLLYMSECILFVYKKTH